MNTCLSEATKRLLVFDKCECSLQITIEEFIYGLEIAAVDV